MSIPRILVLLLAMSLGLLPHVVTPQALTKPTYISEMCVSDFLVQDSTSEYKPNVRTLLADFNNKAYQTSSYTTTVGSGENKVYGQYYCRPDIDSTLCGQCIEEATHSGSCINSNHTTIWYEECILRHNNQSIVGILEPHDIYFYAVTLSSVNVTDSGKFGIVLINTIDKIITEAAYGNGSLGFATGEGVVSESETVYCLVLCSPDLNGTLCHTCLQATFEFMHNISLDSTSWVRWMSIYYSSCQVRYTNYGAFYRLLPGPSPSPETPIKGKKSKHASYYVVRAVIPAAVAALLIILAICFCLFKGKRALTISSQKPTTTTKPATEAGAAEAGVQTTECVQFDLKTIESATNSFSLTNKLGQGGFGIVYQGTLSDGQFIAVKRLSKGSGQGTTEFKTEVAVLAKLQHRNLVQLVGYCVDGEERLLVFEFMRNLSLDRFLFDAIRSAYLTWTIRHKIIQGIARGLHYLHEDLRVKIVHRDLKTSNVLLDDNLEPKIADFGMARLVKVDQTAGNTTKVVGTYGYMSPEYALAGRYSTKSDVYSFGVIVLEILSGKNNSLFYDMSHSEGLLQHAWRVWNGGAIEQLMDPILQNNYSRNEAERWLQIGLLCVQDDATCRPTMHAVLVMLSSNTVDLPPPFSPSHYNYIIKLSSGGETQESSSKQQENGSGLSSSTFSGHMDLYAR